MSKVNQLLDRLKKIKNKEIIFAVIAVVVMLLIYFSSVGVTSKKNEAASSIPSDNYFEEVKRGVVRTVKNIRGAGRTEVAIHWSGSIEYVYAKNTSSSSSSNTSSLQIVSGSNQPVLIKKIYPDVIGVVIVCEGGGNAEVKVNVILAVSTLLDLSTDKILVLEMNKK